MRIKRFEAGNIASALDLVKNEFGPDAVILSYKELRRNGIFGFFRKPMIEVTAAAEMNTNEKKDTDDRKDFEDSIPELSKQNRIPYRFPAFDLKNETASPVSRNPHVTSSGKGRKSPSDNLPSKTLHPIQSKMLNHEMEAGFILQVMEKVKRHSAPGVPLSREQLKGCLIGAFREAEIGVYSSPVNNRIPRCIALMGPSGVGKTSTAAKLATLFYQMNPGSRITMLTMDNERIGAMEQLKRYARIIGVHFGMVTDQNTLQDMMKQQKKRDLFLIDTPSISNGSESKLIEIRDLFSHIPNLEKMLLLSATTKETDLFSIQERFRGIGIDALIFTKTDETESYGAMINHLIRTKTPVCYITNGQVISSDIREIRLESLAEMILEKKFPEKPAHGQFRLIMGIAEKVVKEPVNNVSDAKFLLNTESEIAHYPSCRCLKNVNPVNIRKVAGFEDVEKSGFRQCKICFSRKNGELDAPGEHVKKSM